MTAIRETFEETGILLASRKPKSQVPGLMEEALGKARRSIHAQKLLFTKFLSDNGLEPDIGSLLPFTEWVTPPPVPRRFRAQFFVTFLPIASALSGPTSGTHLNRLPSPDSPDSPTSTSTEVISAQYIHPRAVLTAFARGDMKLMPPQFYLLTTLNEIFSGAGAEVSTAAQRQLVQRLAHSSFGQMVINPRYLPGPEGELPDGRRVLTYEGDESRGGKKGRLHRAIIKPQKGTHLPAELILIRNFDIFTEMGEPPSSKL
ncbi:hypothetical protein EW145_g7455 [Phellinidium pouzarii]|uniref:Nudix hydrolase domain-containing protein n=1 Tax=Phellinidium pouzarii TaxID=167371 RepID=A0A4S4KIU8_9AGAM|nr:hypothetical protein EW145_g7455 [Phellinidium pouzarii]